MEFLTTSITKIRANNIGNISINLNSLIRLTMIKAQIETSLKNSNVSNIIDHYFCD